MSRRISAATAQRRSLAVLVKLLKDPNPRVRLAAARAAGELSSRLRVAEELDARVRALEDEEGIEYTVSHKRAVGAPG